MLLTIFIGGVILYIIGWLMRGGDEAAAQKRMDDRFAEWQAYELDRQTDWRRAIDKADEI